MKIQMYSYGLSDFEEKTCGCAFEFQTELRNEGLLKEFLFYRGSDDAIRKFIHVVLFPSDPTLTIDFEGIFYKDLMTSILDALKYPGAGLVLRIDFKMTVKPFRVHFKIPYYYRVKVVVR
jgi:hypothetical protein